MKFRTNQGKVRHKHAMINGLREQLESMAAWQEIQTLIPGIINRTKNPVSGLRIQVQREESDGLRCLVKSGTAVQHLHIVTTDKQGVRSRIEQMFPPR